MIHGLETPVKQKKRKPRFRGLRVILGEDLLRDVREESHEARALDCGLDGALLLGGKSASLAAHHAAVRVDELLKEVDILLVDVLYVVLCENVCHMLC